MFRYLHSHGTFFPLSNGRSSPFPLTFLLILARESLSMLYYFTIMVKEALNLFAEKLCVFLLRDAS